MKEAGGHFVVQEALGTEKFAQTEGADPCVGQVAQVDPPLHAEGRHLSEHGDNFAEIEIDGRQIHPVFFRLLNKACGAQTSFTQKSKVAHFGIDSCVAVHEYYVLDLFPPAGFPPFWKFGCVH